MSTNERKVLASGPPGELCSKSFLLAEVGLGSAGNRASKTGPLAFGTVEALATSARLFQAAAAFQLWSVGLPVLLCGTWAAFWAISFGSVALPTHLQFSANWNWNFRPHSGELPVASSPPPRPALWSLSCSSCQVSWPVSRKQGLSHLDLIGRHGSPRGHHLFFICPDSLFN